MPKCPRCQKEVYFGKGFLPLPGTGAGLWVLYCTSLQIAGVSQSC